MTNPTKPTTDYIVHYGHDPADGTAYFGPIPQGERDPLNSPAADFWAETGEIDIVYASKMPEGAYANSWDDWLSVVSDA